ncbi:DUF342 domain-containing protein [Agaribacterium haliotis]|uniref:DUF342 domain-containing protein n=1 Tax=Agaribacterium haliotis TaxID=2013869 RepID=UPI0013041F6C|nr:FapA family protein [Agaribacterium haliotis]
MSSASDSPSSRSSKQASPGVENNRHEAPPARRDPPERPQFIPYRFEFDEDKGLLWGHAEEKPTLEQCNEEGSPYQFTEVERNINRVTLPKLQMELEQLGWGELFYPRNSLDSFVRKVKQNFPGRYQLAERKHAGLKITVSNDRKSARAQTTQAWGGMAISDEAIALAVDKARLDERCTIPSALAKLRNCKIAIDVIVAEAKPAVDGDDALIKINVNSKKTVDRDVDSLEAIDMHEVFDYTVVDEGEVLAEKIPASEGEPGLDVLGKAIKPKKGKDLKLPKKGDGVDYHPENKHVLIAKIKGHPVVSPSQAKVDPVLTLKSVDLSSGNIDYDGTVIVTGNVRSGFEVKATGDIFVKGFVNKSHLSAGGSIFISGGVQGDSGDNEHSSSFSAKGNIEAKFINQSKIHCVGELHVKEYLLGCDTLALSKISLGEKSGRGAIIGGVTKCNGPIYVKKLGSEAYISTKIELGTVSAAQKELEKTKLKRERRVAESQQLGQILEKYRQSDTPTLVGKLTVDKARKIEETFLAIQKIIEDYDAHIHALQALVPDADKLYIDVQHRIYPNVSICINDACQEIERELSKVRIEKSEQGLQFQALTTGLKGQA